jgi:hypothetical protein
VVGDSYAMGWGVNQDETFGEVLQKKSGLKVLNTAVASYGTAREMLVLRRLDTSRLRYLIIQYCENDQEENKEFFLKGNRLHAMSPEEYERHTAENRQPKDYYLGKYLGMKLEKKWKEFGKKKDKKDESAAGPDDVDLFLNAVMNGPQDLTRVQIIVFEAVGKDDFDRTFIGRLRERITARPYPAHIKDMNFLDITKVITREQYYVLDDHWTPAGHGAIGEALWEIVQKQQRHGE